MKRILVPIMGINLGGLRITNNLIISLYKVLIWIEATCLVRINCGITKNSFIRQDSLIVILLGGSS